MASPLAQPTPHPGPLPQGERESDVASLLPLPQGERESDVASLLPLPLGERAGVRGSWFQFSPFILTSCTTRKGARTA